MSSLTPDSFVMPDHWPVLDTAAVPFSADEGLEARWRQPRRTERSPQGAEGPRSAMPRLPRKRPSLLGQQWMNALPPQLRPHRTAALHPHVIDQLALAWDRPAQREAVLRDLLLADRHDRRGFSLEVLDELVLLQGR